MAVRRIAGVVALAAAFAAGAAGPAGADQTVLDATVYPGAQGSVSTPSVSFSALQQCPPYTGPSSIYLYPGGQPWVATGSTWTLSEALQCGLGIPAADIASVQIGTLHQGFEAPLSAADLTDPSRYQDPQSPGALPVISSDGTEDQNTYVRPYRGGGDDNARDQVVQSDAPVSVVVYASGALLRVQATAQRLSHTAAATTMRLAAAVHTSTGATVPASALSWSWSFGDGGSSAAPTPTHAFADGVAYVTVEVTDTQTGSGGTATVRVSTPAAGRPGSGEHPGAGTQTGSRSPAGADHGHRHPPSMTAGHAGTPTSPPSRSRASASAPSSPTPASAGPTQTTTTTPAPATRATPRRRPRPAPRPAARPADHARARTPPARRRHQTPARSAPGSRLVSGRLIASVAGVVPAASPSARTSATPPAAIVRPASDGGMSLAGPGAAGAVLGLLGLGAGRELRGHRRWRVPGARR